MSDVESIRIMAFFDIGTVQGNYIEKTTDADGNDIFTDVNPSFSFSDFRYSTGIAAKWLSPFGALQISYAIPLNDKEGDDLQAFQFSFGSQF